MIQTYELHKQLPPHYSEGRFCLRETYEDFSSWGGLEHCTIIDTPEELSQFLKDWESKIDWSELDAMEDIWIVYDRQEDKTFIYTPDGLIPYDGSIEQIEAIERRFGDA